jgi:DNA (cytosine-5)-methyltransferase 1
MATAGPRFLAVDFFCGAGGTTSGLISAGGLVLAGVDNDVLVQKTYEQNNKQRWMQWKRPKFLPYDIFRRTNEHPSGQQHLIRGEVDKLLKQARKAFPSTPLLFSVCAPCQPFTKLSKQAISAARLRKHVRDRSLLLQSVALIKRYKPDIIFCENVASITSSKYGEVWRQFEKDLASEGYVTGTSVVNATDFGIPQNRRRSILLAVKKGKVRLRALSKNKSLVVPSRDAGAKPLTVREAIGHLPAIAAGEVHSFVPNHSARNLSPENVKRLRCAPPGETNSYLKSTRYGDLSLKCHRRVNKRLGVRCFNDVYTRMHPDLPAPTITTRCVSVSNGRFGHYDPKQIRPISVREAAILQSFRSTYVFYPVDVIDPVARMVGNAVPPKLALYFATHLLDLLKGGKN